MSDAFLAELVVESYKEANWAQKILLGKVFNAIFSSFHRNTLMYLKFIEQSE